MKKKKSVTKRLKACKVAIEARLNYKVHYGPSSKCRHASWFDWTKFYANVITSKLSVSCRQNIRLYTRYNLHIQRKINLSHMLSSYVIVYWRLVYRMLHELKCWYKPLIVPIIMIFDFTCLQYILKLYSFYEALMDVFNIRNKVVYWSAGYIKQCL